MTCTVESGELPQSEILLLDCTIINVENFEQRQLCIEWRFIVKKKKLVESKHVFICNTIFVVLHF